MNAFRRGFSTNISKPTSIVSRSTCPYFNLALEDWIFRNTPAPIPLLLFYRNKPSVIIGRNQNPWKEINLDALEEAGILFARRKSGGGTVYHDLGNTNYSIMMPRNSFTRKTNADIVADAVTKLGPPATVNDRNDIVVNGFKVSGSAYKIVKDRAYHHGTMLISAKLDRLGKVLHNTKVNLVTKGVESVRSPVKNLVHWTPDVTHEKFVNAVHQEFHREYGGDVQLHEVDESLLSTEVKVQEVYAELQTWKWQYGETPEFTNKLAQSFDWGDVTASITSKHGEITGMQLEYTPPLVSEHCLDNGQDLCNDIAFYLVGNRYGSLEGVLWEPAFKEEKDINNSIRAWLRRDM